SVTFAGVNAARAPSSRATSTPADASRSTSATRPPPLTKRAAVARPSPDAPPVTMAFTVETFIGSSRGRILPDRLHTAMRTPYVPTRSRRILCVFPEYAKSFGTFQHAYPLFGGRVRAFMPPQGLLVIAAYIPESWEVRFVDENSGRATDADFR